MFEEREGRQGFIHSGKDVLIVVVGAILGFLAALTGIAMVVNRLACGAWATPRGVFDVLSFISSGDTGVFGKTPDGCSAPTWSVITAWSIIIGLILVAVIGGIIWYQVRVESDEYFVEEVRKRRGIAKWWEVRQTLGKRKAKTMAQTVRPTISKKQITPAMGTVKFGISQGVTIYVSMEDSMILIGPPRSGKGVNVLVSAILDAPGPVITTSTRADNYSMTAPLRAKKGPVTLFDPQGLTGKATTLKWSPVTGCQRGQTANQRANSLISAAGLSEHSANSEWKSPAVLIMQSLLHAAALEGLGVEAVMRWGNSAPEATEAVQILRKWEARGEAEAGWATSLESDINEDPKMRGNKWFGVSNAVAGLSVSSVRDVINPRTKDEEFDIDEFIRESGTLYIMGTKSGGTSAGPFLIAMMDAITERAREIAAQRYKSRLDPPMMLVLDEIANITTAWDGLITLMADGGGVGICVLGVFQSMAQVRNSWGSEAASALYDAATVKQQLGGASNTDDLRQLSDLSGDRRVVRVSKSRQESGSSESDNIVDKPVLPVADLRRIPFGYSVLFYRNRRPMVVKISQYWNRKDADQIDAASSLFADSIQSADIDRQWNEAVAWQSSTGEVVESSVVDETDPNADADKPEKSVRMF